MINTSAGHDVDDVANRARSRIASRLRARAAGRWWTGIVVLLACGALAACGSSGGGSSSASAGSSVNAGSSSSSGSGSGSADVSNVTLRIGDQAGVGAQAVLTAAGLIDKLPFKAKWADFAAGAQMLQAMGTGSVDVGDVGNGPPMFAAAGGARLALIEAQRNSPGFSALLLPKGSSVSAASQLKGQKIGVPQGSSSDYHMLAVLTKAGLSVHDASVSYLQPPDALAALASGSVDAVDLWQPYVQQAISQDGARVLTNASGYPGNYSYTVASRDALSDPAKRAAIGDYLKLLNQAYRWADLHPDAWAKVWAKATGLSTTIMDAAAKNAEYTPVPLTKPVIAAEQGVANAFFTAGLIPKKVDVSDYVYTGFNGIVAGGG